MEAQKTLNIQRNPEPKEQCWMDHNTLLQTILQSHNNKNSMALEQKTDMKTNELELKNPDTNPCNYNHMCWKKR
jgi:hypothetical protein